LLAGSGDLPPPRNLQATSASAPSTAPTPSDRRRHALAIALNREAEQASDPSTTLARRIAARESARISPSSSQQDPFFPTARLLSRTTVSVAEPEPPADLRRLATTREAERQLHYRDWHRLGLLDPSTSAGSDGAGISPGRLTPPLAYARRRSSVATTRTFPTLDANTEDQEEDMDVLSMDITHRLRRRLATLDALDPITDSQLERERERDDSGAPLPSVSSSIRNIDRRTARARSWLGVGNGRTSVEWEDGRNDPNGEHTYGDTPASRSRYWNTLPNEATDNLLALAAERMNRPPPSLPPGLGAPSTNTQPHLPTPVAIPEPKSTADPLPSPLGTMLRLTPRQQFLAAFRAS